ncbi:MAG: OmpA family protein [Pelobacteraceae bacterium]
MKKVLKVILPGLLLASLATPGFAENREGAGTLSPFVGGYVLDHKQREENSPIFGLRAGYNFTKSLGAEAMFGYSLTETKQKYGSREADLYRYGIDFLYHFMPDNSFVPFIAVGGGGTNVNIPNTPSAKSHYAGLVNYGAGVKYFVADNVALRGDVRHVILIDDLGDNNLEYSAGLTFQFGGKTKTSAPVAQPVEHDSDGDGVSDSLDKCPGTPAGVAVGKEGCPLDSDRDGVADYLDKCPGTPAGVSVGANGCPVDSDKDGVADYLDKCPATPAGVAVGADGCPLDSDGDGVADTLDKCPGTPAGVKVYTNGCPVDSDQDGVADYLDKCPGTPPGEKVDMNGCTVVAVVPAHVKAAAAKRFCSKPAVLAINFESDKTDIKPQYHDELKTVGDFLSYFPNAKGEISGYTDSTSSPAHNQKLSEQRAESVEKYISKTFKVNPGRIATKGYGEAKPVASNKTKAGRAKNRRIVAHFTCE